MEGEAVAAAAAAGVVGGVRVVARICPPAADPAAPASTAAGAAASSFQVAATRGGSHPRSSDAAALLSFTSATPSSSSSSQGRAPGQRKEEHKLDWCYLQDETNHHIFLNEVNPLVRHLLGGGTTSCNNACVVTCGASTAKDHLFMGSQDQPGLVAMAMEQILEFSKTVAGAVRVSSYQVLQDTHVFDLLEPKDQEVLILEGSDGRTHLKGLSKVDVKSIEDFTQLSCFDTNQNKQTTKDTTQLHTRGHQGLIIHIYSFDQEGRECAVAKINFLNLTAYVDPKQKKNSGAAALSNSKKSMYALMNVAQALNSNQSFIPYRQSKVTRILQDSLCKASGAVLITCLDEISCQDTVSTLSLAARSSQVANEQYRTSMIPSSKKANVNLSAKDKSSSRPFIHSIHQANPAGEKHDRPQWNNSAVKASRTPIANISAVKTSRTPIANISAVKASRTPIANISAVKASRTPIAKKRSQPIMHSVKKTGSSLSTPIKIKQKDAKPTMSGRSELNTCSAKKTDSSLSTSVKIKHKNAKPTTSESTLLCPSIHSSKEAVIVGLPSAVKEVEELQSSQGMEIHAPSKDESFDKTGDISDILDTLSSETQKVVSSSMEEEIHAPSKDESFDKTSDISDILDIVSSEAQNVVSSSTEEEDHSSSGLQPVTSCTDLGETCSSNAHDALVEKTPVNANKHSSKISDRLREISNSLKLLSARPLSITTQKVGTQTTQKVGTEATQNVTMEYVQPANTDVPEPETPVMRLKYEQTEDPSNSFKARSTGIKKSLVQECLTFLNSANKEELKSLKGIGEKRANYIIELRENSPELFKEMDDLRDIIGMNKKEIKRMMSGIIDS